MRSWLPGAALLTTLQACAPTPMPVVPAAPIPAKIGAGWLFEGHGLLELQLEAPLREVFADRGEERTYRPAVLVYRTAEGITRRLNLKIRTRGFYRLREDVCRFPPLRLNFARKAVEDTPFAGQDKLKLVTHCRRYSIYQQYVLEEYLLYRTFNLLTERSFRVRLARITYVDTSRADDRETRYAFLIEDAAALASRVGAEPLEVRQIEREAFDPEALGLVEVFQYMIGNTDWSTFAGEPGESCCHNMKLFRLGGGSAVPVPYDFDLSGAIHTRYATPNPKLGIRSVRTRLYRGTCKPESVLQRSLARFNARREAIYALYRSQGGLDPRRLEKALDYYDEFYATINDPRKVQRWFVEPCRASAPSGRG